eukprot:727184-Hanusia_phi.AAC.1
MSWIESGAVPFLTTRCQQITSICTSGTITDGRSYGEILNYLLLADGKANTQQSSHLNFPSQSPSHLVVGDDRLEMGSMQLIWRGGRCGQTRHSEEEERGGGGGGGKRR